MKLHSGLGLTSRQRAVVSPTDLLGGAILNYTDFTDVSTYTFSSGVVTQQVTAKVGSFHLQQGTVGNQPLYDATAFGNLGGVVAQDATDALLTGATDGGLTTKTYGIVFQLPTYSSNVTLFSIGSSGSGSATAYLRYTGATRVDWLQNEASSAVQVGTTRVGTNIGIIRFNAAGSADFYINTLTPINIDPKDNYNGARTWLMDRGASNGQAGVGFAEFFESNTAVSNSDITLLMQSWSLKYAAALL